MTQINQIQKRQLLTQEKIPNIGKLAKKQIIMLKLVKQKKSLVLVVQELILQKLQLKRKYLTLVTQLKTYSDIKISEIEKKITDHDHNKCITTSEFNKLRTKNIAAHKQSQ